MRPAGLRRVSQPMTHSLSQPTGAKVAGSLHLTVQTVVLIETSWRRVDARADTTRP